MAMKKIVLLFFLIIIGCSNFSKKHLSKSIEEIEYDFIKQKILIPVEINDEVYRFCLDTGAKTTISKELREKLTLKVKNKWNISDGNNQSKLIESVLIDSLKIGTILFKNKEVLAFENAEVFKCFGIDGWIGSDLLYDYIVQIDPKEKLVRFTKDIHSIPLNKSKGEEMVLIGDQRSPYVWIYFDENEKPFKDLLMIDTGMHGIYDLSLDTYERLLKNNKIQLLAKSKGAGTISAFGLGESNEQYLFHYPSLRINDFTLMNYINKATKANYSRIGANLLDYGRMTFDFINKTFYFENQEEEIDLNQKKLSFQPTYMDQKLVVGIVWNERLKNKIQFGDQILEVNGKDLTKFNFCDLVLEPSIFKSDNSPIIKFKSLKDSVFTINLKQFDEGF